MAFFAALFVGIGVGIDMGMMRGEIRHLGRNLQNLAEQVRELANVVSIMVERIRLLERSELRRIAEKCELLESWLHQQVSKALFSESSALEVIEKIMNDTMHNMLQELAPNGTLRFEGEITIRIKYLVEEKIIPFCTTVISILQSMENLLSIVKTCMLPGILNADVSLQVLQHLQKQCDHNAEFFSQNRARIQNLQNLIAEFQVPRLYRVICHTRNGGERHLEAFPNSDESRPKTRGGTQDQFWKITLIEGGKILLTCNTKNRGEKALEAFPQEKLARVKDCSGTNRDQNWKLVAAGGNLFRLRCDTVNCGERYLEAFPNHDKVRMSPFSESEQDQKWFFEPELPMLLKIRCGAA
jgi:hypothetical protein